MDYGESKSKTRKTAPQVSGRLKMRELVHAAGVPKSTVLFYLAAGLLPQPVRTGPNTAWYDPGCVARIGLIRRLQREERLTLAEIATRLREEKHDRPAPPRATRRSGKDPASGDSLGEAPWDPATLSRQTGIPRERLDRLLERGLILPCLEGCFDGEDLAAVRALAALLAAGFEESDLAEYADAAGRLALLERRLLDRRAGGSKAARPSAAAQLAALRRYLFVERLGRLVEREERNGPVRGPQRDPEPWLD